MALVVDYGEDHSFSNSFRGLMNHQLVKEEEKILENVGNLDLTAYVDFRQIRQVALTSKSSKYTEFLIILVIAEGPVPQGQFLECMGIAHRVEALQNMTKNAAKQKSIYDSYARLCSPDEMGAIYKMLFISDKNAGDVYPFLTEETLAKGEYY